MKVEFIECDYPLRREYLEKISKESNTEFFFALIQEEIEEGPSWNKKIKYKKEIVPVVYHPNVIIFNHDIFYGVTHNYEKEKIIGYCPLEFSEEYKEIVRL